MPQHTGDAVAPAGASRSLSKVTCPMAAVAEASAAEMAASVVAGGPIRRPEAGTTTAAMRVAAVVILGMGRW